MPSRSFRGETSPAAGPDLGEDPAVVSDAVARDLDDHVRTERLMAELRDRQPKPGLTRLTIGHLRALLSR